MKAKILNIGDEILLGQTVNTNASFLARNLQLHDVDVEEIVVVGDDKSQITKVLRSFLESDIDVLITTGGLGPTHDDFTKEAIAKELDLELVEFKEAKKHLSRYFPDGMASVNNKQFLYPKGATLLANPLGSALGSVLNYQDKLIFLLVGPPIELAPMFTNYVLPILNKQRKVKKITKSYLLAGISESELEQKLVDLYFQYSTVKMAPYANSGLIRFVTSAEKKDENVFNEVQTKLIEIFGENLIGDASIKIEEHLVDILKKKKHTISFAESCTGGMLASMIVNVSGSSDVFNESIITYSDEAKVKYLQVNPKTLKKHGAVSNYTVNEMAVGLKFLTNSDVSIAVSGIAGPSGGTKQKPVGLVHYAIKIGDNTYLESKLFRGDRNIIRRRACIHILWRTFVYLNNY